MTGSCGWFPVPREAIDAWVRAHRDDVPTTLAVLSVRTFGTLGPPELPGGLPLPPDAHAVA